MERHISDFYPACLLTFSGPGGSEGVRGGAIEAIWGMVCQVCGMANYFACVQCGYDVLPPSFLKPWIHLCILCCNVRLHYVFIFLATIIECTCTYRVLYSWSVWLWALVLNKYTSAYTEEISASQNKLTLDGHQRLFISLTGVHHITFRI